MGRRLDLARVYWRRIRVEGIGRSIGRIAAHPGRLVHHTARLVGGDAVGMSNRYSASASRATDVALVAHALHVDADAAEGAFSEIEADGELIAELTERYRRVRPEWADSFDAGRFKILYALLRLARPTTVVETGVHDGLSTAIMLRALDRNGAGSLTSIDLPSTDLPVGVDGPGWLVPDGLQARWTLCLGDSTRLLPEIAANQRPIDLFLHDSDHSRQHREFEFRAVRDAMSPRGLIVSDDDDPGDTLLDELAAEWSMTHLTNHAHGAPGPSIGLLAP
ncbi:MAG: class I SAM-dependent methyltransferase [Chloroflexota bacterium]|nr:class I SAM-dependent methyltransferase [Chloroflexota bacterium]